MNQPCQTREEWHIEWRPEGTEPWHRYGQVFSTDDAALTLAVLRPAAPVCEFRVTHTTGTVRVLDL